MTRAARAADLAGAYCRIQDDLDRVESLFFEELRSDQPQVAELCRHLARFRGKMLRPALLLLCARAIGRVKPIHRGLAAVVELFHLATLVHDDVLDEAAVRRKVPSINQGWGNEAAVMLGDWLISHAYHLCSRQGSQWASLEISAAAHRVCEGELAQLFRRGDWGLSADDYLSIIEAKTASLTALAAGLGASFGKAPPAAVAACAAFGRDLGVAFQIADDVLDLGGSERNAGKTLGSDLAKGKATLPVIQFLASASPRQAMQFRRLLGAGPRRRGNSPRSGAAARSANGRDLERARRMILDAGCLESARGVARGYVASAKDRLADLPNNRGRCDLLLLADRILVDK